MLPLVALPALDATPVPQAQGLLGQVQDGPFKQSLAHGDLHRLMLISTAAWAQQLH